ncbi:MAG: prepilin-type N-terminal cleavage/methylation domain-containing protein [Verrucomicrobiota bacterium]
MQKPSQSPNPLSYIALRKSGYSLVEMLTVMGVAALLLAVAAPSLVSLAPSRKAAVYQLAGTLENARARALASQNPVYLAVSNENFPEARSRFRTYAIFETTSNSGSWSEREIRQTTEWFSLPEGVVFGESSHFEAVSDFPFRTLHESGRLRRFPVRLAADETSSVLLPYLVFGPDGAVRVPSIGEADALHLAVVEGFPEGTGIVLTSSIREAGRDLGRSELISISFYTGRSRILTDG